MTPTTHINDVPKIIFTVDICIVHNENVLMLKRSETKKVFPNWLALPGGHIEAGETPLSAAIRETKEETGIDISPAKIQLKFLAMHHHIDRNEQYIIFGFLARISEQPTHLVPNTEGTLHWMDTQSIQTSKTIFPPVQYYFDHILNKSGILYNTSVWEHSQLVKVTSEMTDSNS